MWLMIVLCLDNCGYRYVYYIIVCSGAEKKLAIAL